VYIFGPFGLLELYVHEIFVVEISIEMHPEGFRLLKAKIIALWGTYIVQL
jgi:hypothetical protein